MEELTEEQEADVQTAVSQGQILDKIKRQIFLILKFFSDFSKNVIHSLCVETHNY